MHDPDPLYGARITQLTSQPFTSYNVYCEELYTSSDGGRIGFMRFPRGYGRGGHELWICDLATWRVRFVGYVSYALCTSNLFSDWLYYTAPAEGLETAYIPQGIHDLDKPEQFLEYGGPHRLFRVNLRTLEQEHIFSFEKCPPPTSCTISPDGRYFVSITRLRDQRYGLYRVDLRQGTWELFHEHDDILNPHLQFEPGAGKTIMVQHNRGCEVDRDGRTIKLVGDEGATLYLVNPDDGTVHRLPVGKPLTEQATGHECWIARTGRILLSTPHSSGGALLEVGPGDDRARTIVIGHRFCHVSASQDGRFFVVDQMGSVGYGRIWVGSLSTGRYLPLCESHTRRGPYCSEPFPYMTPDCRYVIFNSNATGIGQVHAAEIPAGFLDALEHSHS